MTICRICMKIEFDETTFPSQKSYNCNIGTDSNEKDNYPTFNGGKKKKKKESSNIESNEKLSEDRK